MVKHTLYWALIGSIPLSLVGSLGATALANTIELSVLSLINGSPHNCPRQLIAHETAQPPYEGGFAVNGMIKLREVATNIQLSQSDAFSVTWVGTLKPEYRNCQASGGMLTIDGEPYEGHSYIRLQFINGQVKAILDVTSMGDANELTRVITFKGLREGNPRWTWAGTD